MKNKASQFKQMTEEERSVHLFYTIQNMVENLQEIGNMLDTEAVLGSSRLALISDLDDQIQSICDRINIDYTADKVKNAVAYSI